jgi:hypothetical protein
VRLPGGALFIVCTFCHQRLAGLYPSYHELCAAIFEAHPHLRGLTP